jgi:hypothetical protein
MQPQKSTQKHTKEELKVDIEKLLDMLDSGAVDDSFSNIVTDNLKSYIDENEYDQLVESIDSYNYENAVELLQKISNKI